MHEVIPKHRRYASRIHSNATSTPVTRAQEGDPANDIAEAS